MRTKSINKSEINHDWWVADAEDQTLGRFASRIAQVLSSASATHQSWFISDLLIDFVLIIFTSVKVGEGSITLQS